MTAAVSILFAIAAIYVLNKILIKLLEFNRTRQMAAKIPGLPFVTSLTMPTEHALGEFFTTKTQEAARRGETIMGMWFGHIYTVMPLTGKAIKEVLDSHEEITKASDYDIMRPWLGDGLVNSTGEKWKNRRRLLTPTFHFDMLKGYVSTMDKHAAKLVNFLGKSANNGKIVDVFPIIKRATLDIICEAAMGKDLNCLEEEHNSYSQAVADIGTITTKYSFDPTLWFWPIRKLSGFDKTFDRLNDTLTTFSKEVIKERRAARRSATSTVSKETKRKAFLDMLLDMKEAETFTDEDIREQVDTFMFAGHDTTSTLISWTIWSFACFPEIQEKVYDEVMSVIGDATEITVDDIKEMHYLDRVIKETMRINPPVPFAGRNLQNDMNINGYTVPRGSNVYIAPLLIHRNESIYPNPTKFDPDRFLPEATKNRYAYDFIPFSAGPRNCIGMKFAQYESRIFLGRLVREFCFSTNMGFFENLGCPEIILRPQHGTPVFLKKR